MTTNHFARVRAPEDENEMSNTAHEKEGLPFRPRENKTRILSG
jgi:hypothetical protein